jgi:predicted amidohydrolase
MIYHLHVAIWTLPTEVTARTELPTAGQVINLTGLLDISERCRILGEVVDQAVGAMGTHADKADERHLYLFLAPEYYFSKSNEEHVLGLAESDTAYNRLLELSARHEDLLLLPGTMSYCKSLYTPKGDAKGQARKAIKEKNERVLAKAIKAVQDSGNPSNKNDYLAVLNSKKKKMYKNIQIVHNKVYVFYQGAQYFTYNKRDDANEIFQSENPEGLLVYVPGSRSGKFQFANLDFGIEICADHFTGVLKAEGVTALDVQIVLSASTSFREENAVVVDGGYVLHADAGKSLHPNAARVWRRTKGQMDEVTTGKTLDKPKMDPNLIGNAERRVLASMGEKNFPKNKETIATATGGMLSVYNLPLQK